MFCGMKAQIIRTCVCFVFAFGSCIVATAADFRVENRVYSGAKKEPDSQSTTIFRDAFVYDFLQRPAETIVFDKSGGRFVILDDAKQVRTEIGTKELENFTQKLKERASREQDPLARFLAEPVFEERYDASRRELILFSDVVNYRAVTTAVDNSVASQYREFSDWYARLNSILIPGSRPPFARFKLNEALAKRESIAREVTLTITVVKDGKSQASSVRSEHVLGLTLSPADMELVERAKKSMAGYKPVSLDKYRQAK
jgi:hypothetical protein